MTDPVRTDSRAFCQNPVVDMRGVSLYNESLTHGGVKVSTGIARHGKRVAVRTRYKIRKLSK